MSRLLARQIGALTVAILTLASARASAASRSAFASLAADVSGTISDSASGQPLPSAEVSVSRAGQIVMNTQTDAFGRYTVHNLPAGDYTVLVRMIGFHPATRAFTVAQGAPDLRNFDFKLVPAAVSLTAVTVAATVPLAVDTRTGEQVFKQNDYHGAPTNTTSQIVQLATAGAVRAPTGEVHIRGQHAEYTYYVDGVPVPSGVSGSLNELFDPQVVDQIRFVTGGWDAEYGNKNTAIVNVNTRIPVGGFHSDVGAYVGQYDSQTQGTKAFNGQSLSASTNSGPWGFFFSGARQFTNMRREPLVFDTSGKRVVNFHNDGTDYFGFGKIQFTPSTNDVLNLDLSSSRTNFQVPFDSSGGTLLDDRQTDVNGFANLGWRRQMRSAGGEPSDLFASAFYRHGSLNYTPGVNDQPQFTFFPDTVTAYNLFERRSFNTAGVKLDYTVRPQHELEFKIGTLASQTRGHETFTSTDASGTQGPSSNSALKGSDLGVYAQTAYSPTEMFEIRTGVRYDAHNAPFAGTRTQVSPRARLNFFPAPSLSLYVYYAKLFMPTNVEDLRAITSDAQGGVAAEPTLPERDNFYEAGLVQRLPNGVAVKLSAYHKDSKPGIDDATVPGSSIVTSVNIDHVRVTGVEGVVELRPNGPLSAYLNASVTHAWGTGPIAGGFFPIANPAGNFDLDHDQRVSLVASATYSVNRLFASATEIYGSGLTNGVAPADCGCSYGTGLFAMNSGIKVKPSAITNFSAGYTLVSRGTVIKPQLFIENVFNKKYLLKGAFFSGASVGRPRSIQLRLDVAK